MCEREGNDGEVKKTKEETASMLMLLSAQSPLTTLYSRTQRIHGLKCCSIRNNNATLYTKTPPLLKIAVSGVTELLRLLSPPQPKRGNQNQKDEIPVSSIDDVLMIIQSDYMNAYFVTGNFTCSIYAEDCIFEDPTISFRGRELYARNLKLLVPFFDSASITLQNIDKAVASDTNLVVATWKLRTNLKLPWRPLISIDGSTRYELDKEFKIVKHVESWNVSALEAIAQIFTFNFGKSAG